MKLFNESFVVEKSKFLIKIVFPSPTSLFLTTSDLSPSQPAFSFFGLSSSPEPVSTSESEVSSSCPLSLSSSSSDLSFLSFSSAEGCVFGTSSVLLFEAVYCCLGMAQSTAICLPKEKYETRT
jgi:hypothetical protein